MEGVGTNFISKLPSGIDISPDGVYALIIDENKIYKLILSTSKITTIAGQTDAGNGDGIGTNSEFYHANSINISPDGTYALITDSLSNIIHKLDISTTEVTTIAGQKIPSTIQHSDGIGTNSIFNYPCGINISPNSKFALITDTSNYQIRYINLAEIRALQSSFLSNPNVTSEKKR